MSEELETLKSIQSIPVQTRTIPIGLGMEAKHFRPILI